MSLFSLTWPIRGDGVFLHDPAVIPRCGGADDRLGAQIEPQPQPFFHGVLSRARDIQLLALRNGHGQLALDFRPGPAQHPFAVLVVPSGVPPFPAPILPLTDVSFPRWLVSWPSLVPPLSESLTGPFLFLVVERVGGR